MKKLLLLYAPVLHEGYLKFFKKYKEETETLYLIGEDLSREFTALHKEIRAIEPEIMKQLIESLGLFKSVCLLDHQSLAGLKDAEIITADEEISRRLIGKYLPENKVVFDTVFLRWDEKKIQSLKPPENIKISTAEFDRKMIERAGGLAGKSSDWWRQVGAVIVKNGEVILEAHNRHVPSEHQPYAEGDPRDVIPAGTLSELYTSLHAEQAVIVEAARRGLGLEETSIYLTSFPCPVCAKLIAYSGIKKCFFSAGSASLDGERVLKAKKVEIILVSPAPFGT